MCDCTNAITPLHHTTKSHKTKPKHARRALLRAETALSSPTPSKQLNATTTGQGRTALPTKLRSDGHSILLVKLQDVSKSCASRFALLVLLITAPSVPNAAAAIATAAAAAAFSPPLAST